MKIVEKIFLHPILTLFGGFAEIRFAKNGREDGVFGVLRLDVGIGLLCFARICDWYSPYVYVMHVCN